jgi:hypothetical protein
VRNLRWRLSIAAIAGTLLQVLAGESAGALSNRGPDLADLGAGAGDVVGYVLVDEAAAVIRTVQVPLYFTENTSAKSVTIHDVNLCTDGLNSAPNSGGNYRDRNNNGYPTTRRVSAYSVVGGATVYGYPSASNNCYKSTKTINIPNGNLTFDAGIGMYRTDFSALLPAGISQVQNHFYITLNRADAIVGYSKSADASRFGMAQEYPQGGYKRYNLPFAPDCTVSSTKSVRASLYDDDNGTPGVQPREFRVYIQEYTAAGVPTQRVPLTVTANSKTNLGNNTWIAKSGNRNYAHLDFTVRAGYKYRWVLDSIYSVNLLQFQLPFDSIYFEKPCTTSVSRTSSISPTPVVEEGQMMTGKFAIINNGPIPGVVDYTRYVWRDDNNNGSWDNNETRFLNDSGTATIAAKSTQNLSDWTEAASLAKHGARVCVGIRITPAVGTTTVTSTAWDIHCTSIGKKPRVQVWGSDVRVGGKIETSTGLVDVDGTNKLFGSWVEYGSLSVGTNTGFASGSGLNDGFAGADSKEWNKLTFANVDESGANQYGLYTLAPSVSPAGQFAAATSDGVPGNDLGALASGTYKTTNLTINASNVGQDGANRGKSIIIVASGTVTIQGDITYGAPGGGYTAISQLPQVVIVANKINIAGSVGQVSAWLLTTGEDGAINTCTDRALNAPLNATVCNNKLTVYGPVATQHLYLRRTAGANPNDSAELFNLRPDAYMWAHQRASGNGKAQTVYTTELPPRF